MFERFDADADAIMLAAEGHARRLGHDWMGGEHVLMAIASAPDPLGGALRDNGITVQRIEEILLGPDPLDRDALAAVGIDLDAVRTAVEDGFGPGALRRRPGRGRPCDELSMTPRLKECLAAARRAAGGGAVRSEHVAVAVVSMRHSAVPHILGRAGVSGDVLATAIRDRFRQAG